MVIEEESDSEIEIGCRDCEKMREKEIKLSEQLEQKSTLIHDLEKKIEEKLDIDVDSFQSQRLKMTMEEAKRHFENYVLVRDMYHNVLESKAKKKKNKRLKTDSEFLKLKSSLQ